MSTIGSELVNGLLVLDATFATVIFLYPAGDAIADTLKINHFVMSVACTSLMFPFIVLDESSNVSNIAVTVDPALLNKSALIVVAAFCVALLKRNMPSPGSESVVVVENV